MKIINFLENFKLRSSARGLLRITQGIRTGPETASTASRDLLRVLQRPVEMPGPSTECTEVPTRISNETLENHENSLSNTCWEHWSLAPSRVPRHLHGSLEAT